MKIPINKQMKLGELIGTYGVEEVLEYIGEWLRDEASWAEEDDLNQQARAYKALSAKLFEDVNTFRES